MEKQPGGYEGPPPGRPGGSGGFYWGNYGDQHQVGMVTKRISIRKTRGAYQMDHHQGNQGIT